MCLQMFTPHPLSYLLFLFKCIFTEKYFNFKEPQTSYLLYKCYLYRRTCLMSKHVKSIWSFTFLLKENKSLKIRGQKEDVGKNKNINGKTRAHLTLRLLMSYIYGAPSKARNANVVYIWTYVWQRWNSLFLSAAQCFNTESMQRGFLCHICV